jgi:hypothetical protein
MLVDALVTFSAVLAAVPCVHAKAIKDVDTPSTAYGPDWQNCAPHIC